MNRFRPLTASKVSEHKPVVLKLRVVNRFRPLSGNKVSEQMKMGHIANINKMFPSPLGE